MTPAPPGSCWQCGSSLAPEEFRRGETCPKCRYETRCCRNCRFYDPSYSRQCRETEADPPVDKEKTNFCEFFTAKSPRRGDEAPKSVFGQRGDDSKARKAFESLFKKKPPKA